MSDLTPIAVMRIYNLYHWPLRCLSTLEGWFTVPGGHIEDLVDTLDQRTDRTFYFGIYLESRVKVKATKLKGYSQ